MIHLMFIILSTITNLISQVDLSQIYLNENSVHTFARGEQIELNCPFEEASNDNNVNLFSWYKDKEKLFSVLTDKRVQINLNRLVISEFLPTDCGTYECQLVKGNGEIVRSKTIILQSIENNLKASGNYLVRAKTHVISGNSPVFINDHQNRTKYFFEQSELDLDCSAFGSPRPSVLWYKNGQVVGEEEYGLVRNKMSFKFRRLVSSDSGEYRCQVSNEHGQINRHFRIQVAAIKKVATKANELVSLECRSDNAEWYVHYKNKNIKSRSSQVMIGFNLFYKLVTNELHLTESNKLMLISPSILENGLYVCMTKGQLSSQVYDLDVIEFRTRGELALDLENPRQNLGHSTIPLSIIAIIIFSIFSVLFISVLFCYYWIKLRSDKEISVGIDNLPRKMNENRQISNSLHHLSRGSIENSNYNLKRYSFVPMVTNSTPNNRGLDQMAVVYSKNTTPQNPIIVNLPKPIQFNYYPIYHLNSKQPSSLTNHSISTRPLSQK